MGPQSSFPPVCLPLLWVLLSSLPFTVPPFFSPSCLFLLPFPLFPARLSLQPLSSSPIFPSNLCGSPRPAQSCLGSDSQQHSQQPGTSLACSSQGCPASVRLLPLPWCFFFFFPWCFLFWIQAQRGPLRRKLGCLRCRLSAEGTACQLAELRRTVWSAQGPLEPGQGWQPRAAAGQARGSTSWTSFSASPGSVSPTQARSLPAVRGLQGQVAAAVLGRGSHWYVG